MKTIFKVLSFLLILTLISPSAAFFSGADEYEIIEDGLAAWYDGTKNTKAGHNSGATVWEDLMGNNDVTVLKNSSNYFTETAYHLNSNKNTFPKALLDLINGEEFTVELKLGEIKSVGSSFATFINCSGNDNFSLFTRTAGDFLEFKHSSSTSDRPKVAGGRELAQNSTIAVTRSLKNKICIMYVDGVKVGEGPVSAVVGATGDLFFGHTGSKGHEADYEAMRFYNRALSEEEIINNAKADGNYDFDYQPPREYTAVAQPDTNIAGGIALSEYVDSIQKYEELFTKEVKPAIAIFFINSQLQLTDRTGALLGELTIEDLENANDNTVIPAFYVWDKEAVNVLLEALESVKFEDFYVMSNDESLVKLARETTPICRGIIDYSEKYKNQDDLSHEEIIEIRKSVISNLSHVVVLPQSVANKEDIGEMCKLQLTPWIKANDNLTSKKDALYLVLSSAYGVISDNTTLLVDVATNTLVTGTLARTPVNIGHRGIPSKADLAPENTLESAILAYENGANAIELDIYITRDNVLVINHNSSTTNMCLESNDKSVSMSLESYEMSELSKLYYSGYYEKNEDGTFKLDDQGNKIIYRGFRLPTLESYLKEFKGKDVQLIIEIKSSKVTVVPEMKKLIEKYDMYDQCNVITFERTNQHKEMLKNYPEMNVGFLTDTTNTNMSDSAASVKTTLDSMQHYNATFNPSRTGYISSFVRAATYRGLTIWPWTINNASEIYQFILYGHAGLTGNYADTFASFARDFTATAPDHVMPGSTVNVDAKVMTYARVTSNAADAVIIIIEGEDLVESINGLKIKLKSGAEGEVSFILSYKQVMNNTYNYTLYTQPLTVTVDNEVPPPSSDTTPSEDSSSPAPLPSENPSSENTPSSDEKIIFPGIGIIVAGIAIGVVILLAVVTVVVLIVLKKKKLSNNAKK